MQNPHLYSIAYGDARPGVNSAAAEAIDAILRTLLEQVARAGLLACRSPTRSTSCGPSGGGRVHARGHARGPPRPAPVDRGLHAVLRTILVDRSAVPAQGTSGAAMQLRADLDGLTQLTPHERACSATGSTASPPETLRPQKPGGLPCVPAMVVRMAAQVGRRGLGVDPRVAATSAPEAAAPGRLIHTEITVPRAPRIREASFSFLSRVPEESR